MLSYFNSFIESRKIYLEILLNFLNLLEFVLVLLYRMDKNALKNMTNAFF